MTDKHIKKGIDVSQCEHYSMTYDSCNFTISGSCVKENCQTFRILQQLKRKEQWLEEVCKAFDIEYITDKETENLIARCNKLYKKEQECEELKHKVELMMDCAFCKINEYKQTLAEIIKFFKEDEKFARYSGRPIIFVKPALEKIEKILKENNIKIS